MKQNFKSNVTETLGSMPSQISVLEVQSQKLRPKSKSLERHQVGFPEAEGDDDVTGMRCNSEATRWGRVTPEAPKGLHQHGMAARHICP